MSQPLTAAQLAEALGLTTETVNQLAQRGEIPCHLIGRNRFFVLTDVLASTKVPARPKPQQIRASQDDQLAEYRAFIASRGRRVGDAQPRRTKRKARPRG